MGCSNKQKKQRPNSGNLDLRVFLLFIFLLRFTYSFSQFIEFGGGLGVLNYSGDLVRGYNFSTMTPALTAHYRMNFSKELSVKWTGVMGNLQSQETPIDAFAELRGYNYSMRIGEVASVVEYHFLDYKNEKSLIRWSPYAFGGFGFTRILNAPERRSNFNRTQAVIPFGVGFKQLVGKRFSVDAEIGFRKTFFDWIDNTSEADITVKDYQYGNPNDNDWYTFIGLTLSFILYEIPCPFPYEPNKYMVRTKFR
jgi:hypothetical protein